LHQLLWKKRKDPQKKSEVAVLVKGFLLDGVPLSKAEKKLLLLFLIKLLALRI